MMNDKQEDPSIDARKLGWIVRRYVAGLVPWPVIIVGYSAIRRLPRLYFILRVLIMGQISGPPK